VGSVGAECRRLPKEDVPSVDLFVSLRRRREIWIT
jgi:hypothetical protein